MGKSEDTEEDLVERAEAERRQGFVLGGEHGPIRTLRAARISARRHFTASPHTTHPHTRRVGTGRDGVVNLAMPMRT